MNKVLRYSADLSQRLSMNISYSDPNNNSDNMSVSPGGEKYSLRPRSMRRAGSDEDEIRPVPTATKLRTSKAKQKPAPLSKYRRKTANARERSRMREINAAFETLRRAVPHLQCPDVSPAASTNEKLTKITTLRLAMKYISALSSALKESTSPGASLMKSPASDLGDLLSDCSDLDCLFLESDGESLQLNSDLSDHSLTSADFTTDFPDHSLTPVDLGEHSLSPTFPDQSLSSFDTFFSDFT
ncbi:taxi [Carabus blaptoides fortunei]